MLGHVPGPQDTLNVFGVTLGHTQMIRVTGVLLFLLCLVPLIFGGKIYNSIKAVLSVKVVRRARVPAVPGGHADELGDVAGDHHGVLQVRHGADRADDARTTSSPPSPRAGRCRRSTSRTSRCWRRSRRSPGSGGLTNAVISNYTRDQGWGMGRHVGAIPSIVGGHQIALSHSGTVFDVNEQSLPRWRGWLRHVHARPGGGVDGRVLPRRRAAGMLSVHFLQRGTEAKDWTAAVMTADGVREHVASDWGMAWGTGMWYAVVLCGLLVLLPTTCQTADGIIRRWVDVLWTASPRLREVETHRIKQLYFRVLVGYAMFGTITLSVSHSPGTVVKIATNIYNFALGISCFHTLYVNLTLLPKPLRPGWFARTGMIVAGVFFVALATVAAIQTARTLMG